MKLCYRLHQHSQVISDEEVVIMLTVRIDVTDSELLAVPGGPYAVLQRIRWEVAPELAPPQDPWGEETLLSSLYNPALVTTW